VIIQSKVPETAEIRQGLCRRSWLSANPLLITG